MSMGFRRRPGAPTTRNAAPGLPVYASPPCFFLQKRLKPALPRGLAFRGLSYFRNHFVSICDENIVSCLMDPSGIC